MLKYGELFNSRNLIMRCLYMLVMSVFCLPLLPEIINFESVNSLRIDASAVIQMLFYFQKKINLGIDLIHPYGPYQFVRYTGIFWPSTYLIQVALNLALIISTSLICLKLFSSKELSWFCFLLITLFLILSFENGTDAPYDFYFALSFYSYSMGYVKGILEKILIGFCIAVLSLIKFPFFILSCAFIGFSMFWDCKRRDFPVLLISSIVAFICLWRFSGQSLINVAPWIASSFDLSSKYTDVMSFGWLEINLLFQLVVFASSFFIILLNILKRFREKEYKNTTIFIVLLFFLIYLFIIFKHGVVRHDGHAADLAMSTILLLLLTGGNSFSTKLTFPQNLKFFFVLLLVALNSYIFSQYHSNFILSPLKNLSKINQTVDIFKNNYELNLEFENRLAKYGGLNKFNSSSTVDAWPDNAALAIFSGGQYSPRPQSFSFSAYTALSRKANYDFYSGHNAPDRIIFQVNTIDGHLPTEDDSLAWFAILQNYKIETEKNEYLILRRLEKPLDIKFNNPIQVRGVLDRIINVADYSDTPLKAKFRIEKNSLGKFVSFFFKIPPVMMELKTINGGTYYFRVANASDSEFILSPVVESNYDFVGLKSAQDFGKRVSAIRFYTSGEIFYDNNFQLYLYGFSVPNIETLPPSLHEKFRRKRMLELASNTPGVKMPTHVRFVGIKLDDSSDKEVLLAHAPTTLSVPVQPNSKVLSIKYGLLPGIEKQAESDGVIFSIIGLDRKGYAVTLFSKKLNPAHNPQDVGIKSVSVPIPKSVINIKLQTEPVENDAYDHSYWGDLDIN